MRTTTKRAKSERDERGEGMGERIDHRNGATSPRVSLLMSYFK
jgi:hypothetical protein